MVLFVSADVSFSHISSVKFGGSHTKAAFRETKNVYLSLQVCVFGALVWFCFDLHLISLCLILTWGHVPVLPPPIQYVFLLFHVLCQNEAIAVPLLQAELAYSCRFQSFLSSQLGHVVKTTPKVCHVWYVGWNIRLCYQMYLRRLHSVTLYRFYKKKGMWIVLYIVLNKVLYIQDIFCML